MRRRMPEKLQAWIVTGPLGHLWSALADMTIIWTRYRVNRARAGLRMGAAIGRRGRV